MSAETETKPSLEQAARSQMEALFDIEALLVVAIDRNETEAEEWRLISIAKQRVQAAIDALGPALGE